MTGLKIARDLTLSLDYVTKTVGILAQRRKGKTYTANVIAEEFVAAGLPFVALDPTGAWWGLRASADGDREGLPVTILGGEHGDVPLERTDGKGVAELVVDEPGWYVIDFSLFESNAAEVQFAADFAQRLYRRKGQPNSDFPMHLFVDEADRFVPQRPARAKGEGAETTMLGAFEAIVRRGGLRGLGTTLISQRSAVVNKNVLEQCDVMIVLRTVGPNDRDRIMEIVSAEGTKEQIAEVKSSMASLDLGEAWFWEPGEGIFQRIHVRERRTFNSSATPKPGEKRVQPRQLASVDLEVIKQRWEATIEKAKADDPKELRRQIQLVQSTVAAQAKTIKQLEAHVCPEAAPVVEPLVKPEDVEMFTRLAGVLAAVAPTLEDLVDRMKEAAGGGGQDAPRARKPGGRVVPMPTRPSRDRPAAHEPRPSATDRGELLSGPQRKVMSVLATYGAVSKRRLAMQAGYSARGGAFNNTLSSLRARGCINRGDPIEATELGLELLGAYEPLPRGQALIDHWLASLTVPQGKILRALIEHGPLEKDELATECGYEPTGGAFNNNLSALRTLELITRGRPIELTDEFATAINA